MTVDGKISRCAYRARPSRAREIQKWLLENQPHANLIKAQPCEISPFSFLAQLSWTTSSSLGGFFTLWLCIFLAFFGYYASLACIAGVIIPATFVSADYLTEKHPKLTAWLKAQIMHGSSRWMGVHIVVEDIREALHNSSLMMHSLKEKDSSDADATTTLTSAGEKNKNKNLALAQSCILGIEPHDVLPLGCCSMAAGTEAFLMQRTSPVGCHQGTYSLDADGRPRNLADESSSGPGGGCSATKSSSSSSSLECKQTGKNEVLELHLRETHMAITGAILKVPIFNVFCHLCGGRDASKAVLVEELERGNNVGICPGGVKEVIYNFAYTLSPAELKEHNIEPGSKNYKIVFLKERKGFAKLAVEKKRPLVPIFIFGQEKLFYPLLLAPPQSWSFLRGSWEKTTRVIGFVPILPLGLFLTLPFPGSLSVVVGKAIQGTDMNAVHEEYCRELKRIAETYAPCFGYGKDFRLIVM